MTFEEVRHIFQSYTVLNEKISGNRFSYQLEHSIQRGKEVAREIICNKDGSCNGYLNAKYLPNNLKKKYDKYIDPRQMIKIKYFTHDQLHEAIQDVIYSMTYRYTIKRSV